MFGPSEPVNQGLGREEGDVGLRHKDQWGDLKLCFVAQWPTDNTTSSQTQCLTPIIPAIQEADAEGWQIQIHLGNMAELCSNNYNNNNNNVFLKTAVMLVFCVLITTKTTTIWGNRYGNYLINFTMYAYIHIHIYMCIYTYIKASQWAWWTHSVFSNWMEDSPTATKFHKCSNPLYKVVLYLPVTYEHPFLYFGFVTVNF